MECTFFKAWLGQVLECCSSIGYQQKNTTRHHWHTHVTPLQCLIDTCQRIILKEHALGCINSKKSLVIVECIVQIRMRKNLSNVFMGISRIQISVECVYVQRFYLTSCQIILISKRTSLLVSPALRTWRWPAVFRSHDVWGRDSGSDRLAFLATKKYS